MDSSEVDAIARDEAVNILMQYEKKSQSLRSIIREHLADQSLGYIISARVQSFSLGVIRYRNTIDFILNRSIPSGTLKQMHLLELNRLRLALFESRWLKTQYEILESTIERKLNHTTLKRAIEFDLASAVKSMNPTGRHSVIYSHPTFLVQTLAEKLGTRESINLMKHNNKPLTTYLRVNQLISNPDEVISSITERGVSLESDKDIPFLYIVKDGLGIVIESDEFKTGEIFIQDKASVLTVTTLNPKPGEHIWDACAAPGMKTHLIWELMNREGNLVASDISSKRLLNAQQRFETFGTDQIEWIHSDASKTPILGANKILIDAPCTSTGILQSHPSYKWRLNKRWLFSIMTIQNKILDGIISAYSDYPGTEIVYATCSILPHEGENQIDSVLDRHNIELLDGPEIGGKGYSDFSCSDKVRRLFPHTHDTSGFFIAHLKISD